MLRIRSQGKRLSSFGLPANAAATRRDPLVSGAGKGDGRASRLAEANRECDWRLGITAAMPMTSLNPSRRL
jgi:hypothetical protein